MTDDELALFYNATDIVVNPSKMEGFSFPVLEAMACGKAVVCSNSGALPEITGGAARLVSANTGNSYALAIREVLENQDLCKELAEKGLRRA